MGSVRCEGESSSEEWSVEVIVFTDRAEREVSPPFIEEREEAAEDGFGETSRMCSKQGGSSSAVVSSSSSSSSCIRIVVVIVAVVVVVVEVVVGCVRGISAGALRCSRCAPSLLPVLLLVLAGGEGPSSRSLSLLESGSEFPVAGRIGSRWGWLSCPSFLPPPPPPSSSFPLVSISSSSSINEPVEEER